MKYVYIGKETATTMEDIHAEFRRVFNFPEYYGNNLDALHDCLTEVTEESLVLLADTDFYCKTLETKYAVFRIMLNDIVMENRNISFRELY